MWPICNAAYLRLSGLPSRPTGRSPVFQNRRASSPGVNARRATSAFESALRSGAALAASGRDQAGPTTERASSACGGAIARRGSAHLKALSTTGVNRAGCPQPGARSKPLSERRQRAGKRNSERASTNGEASVAEAACVSIIMGPGNRGDAMSNPDDVLDPWRARPATRGCNQRTVRDLQQAGYSGFTVAAALGHVAANNAAILEDPDLIEEPGARFDTYADRLRDMARKSEAKDDLSAEDRARQIRNGLCSTATSRAGSFTK